MQAKGGNILLCYSVEDPAVGYVQGMNMVMAGVLYHVRDETKTYAVVRKLFHQIRSIYLNGTSPLTQISRSAIGMSNTSCNSSNNTS